jgi:hypothetical protein
MQVVQRDALHITFLILLIKMLMSTIHFSLMRFYSNAFEQVSFAIMAADISTANQLSALLSDSAGFTSYLARQNFPDVSVTSKPAVFDKNNSPVTVFSSGPCLTSNPALVVVAFFAAAAVREVLY